MVWPRQLRRVSWVTTVTFVMLVLWYSTPIISPVLVQDRHLYTPDHQWTSSNNSYSLPSPDATRFLAYIPHSGFHNQRIELENALILSILLNRTLVLPLARLGAHPLPYKPFDELFERYSQSDKSWLSHCWDADTAANSTVKECRKFERYTHISWQDIINLTTLVDLGAKIIERWNFRASWFSDTLGIGEDDVYWLKDSSTYQFRFFDNVEDSTGHGKYQNRINVPELEVATQGHALLHVGTLFGTSRIRLSDPSNRALRTRIRAAMELDNPFLTHLADRIVSHIGGKDTFFSAHLRLGDGFFAEDAKMNAHGIWERVLLESYTLKEELIDLLPVSQQLVQHHTFTGIPRSVPLQPLPFHLRAKCRASRTIPSLLSTPLFIATDALSPRTHPALGLFTSTFPCVYFLAEFRSIINVLERVVNPLDNSHMARFLLPFVDALVAAQGASIVGTPESTFSRYVEDVLWPVEHGLEIAV